MSSSLTDLSERYWEAVEFFSDADLPSLREALSVVTDPRKRRGVRYAFTELLLVIVAAVISGSKTLTMIAEWAQDAHERQILGAWTRQRTPSVPTLHRIITSINPEALDTAISYWLCHRLHTMSGPQRQAKPLSAVAVDGKEIRGAKHGGGKKTMLMAALDHQTATVLTQESVGDKTNEIPHLPALLDKLARLGQLQDTVITADALHTLAQQAQAITGRRGHYLFTVKTNAKTLHTQIASANWAFNQPQFRTSEKAHGRTSTWEVTTLPTPDRIDFPAAQQILRVQRARTEHHTGQATAEIVYAITSLPPEAADAATLAGLLRGHWGIENRLHWIRDTAYNEDTSQIRAGHGAHVMASLRNLAINILRLNGHTNITAALRHYGRDPQRAVKLTGL